MIDIKSYNQRLRNTRYIVNEEREKIHQAQIPGIVGTGITHSIVTGIGKDEFQMVVFLENEQYRDDYYNPYSGKYQLPRSINGIKVISKIIGTVEATKVGTSADYLRTSTDAKSWQEIPRGEIKTNRFADYYDVSHTITTALPTPVSGVLTFDDVGYNRERIFVEKERYGDKVTVTNDAAVGGGTLFVVISHGGETSFSQETPIYPQEYKIYWNVYELRLRSPVQGLPYRVMEYEVGSL